MLWLALGFGAVILAIAAGKRSASRARPAGASVLAQNRTGARASDWPRAGIYGTRWTPTGARPGGVSVYGTLPGPSIHDASAKELEQRREDALLNLLAAGKYLFNQNQGDAAFAPTWERDERLIAGLLAELFLEYSRARVGVTASELFDVSVAFGVTEAALAAADGHDPNAAYFDALAVEDARRRDQARGIVNRGMAAFSSGDVAAIGATMAEIVAFFYTALSNVDWSMKSHGAGPRLRLEGLPWTPAQAERIAHEAYKMATQLRGDG